MTDKFVKYLSPDVYASQCPDQEEKKERETEKCRGQQVTDVLPATLCQEEVKPLSEFYLDT